MSLAIAAPATAGWFSIDAGRGPIEIYVPSSYDSSRPAPLLVFLHAYRWTAAQTEIYFDLEPLAEDYGFVLALPEGRSNPWGDSFWNATWGCCDFFDERPDDSGYLRRLIEQLQADLSLDPERVHVAGFSNGGFMAHRMACDHPDVVASVASLSGATFLDPADCDPPLPVHVLEIHGTADPWIRYEGGVFMGSPHPGAIETAEQWATLLGCAIDADATLPSIDFDASIPGEETTARRYASGCFPFGSVELWSIQGGGHIPALSTEALRAVFDYFDRNPQIPQPTSLATAEPPAGVGALPPDEGGAKDSGSLPVDPEALVDASPYECLLNPDSAMDCWDFSVD